MTRSRTSPGDAAHAPLAKTPGIKEIARAAGVSIGTVDRALHARPGISDVTRSRIMHTADRLGYRPNLVARSLKISHQKKIGVHLPKEIASYFDSIRAGIRQAARQLQPVVTIEFSTYPRIGTGDVAALRAALDRHYDGLILLPTSLSSTTPIIRDAGRNGLPVVCVASEAPGTDRLTTVSCDPYLSGATAAELLMRAMGKAGKCVIITGELTTFDHAEKVRGFRGMLETHGSGPSLVDIAEAHDDYDEAYRHCRRLLRRHSKLTAIYVSTSNSLPVLHALETQGRIADVSVVVTDLFAEILPYLRSGAVLAALYQQPLVQGRRAFEVLHQFLTEGVRPLSAYQLTPQIVLRSNVEGFVRETGLDSIDSSSTLDPAPFVADTPGQARPALRRY